MIKIIIGGQARTGGALLARILDGFPQTISLPHEPTFYYKYNNSLYGKNSSIYDVFNFFKLEKDKLFFKRKYTNFYEDLNRNIKIKINHKKIDEELTEILDRNITYDEAINLYARIANNNIFNVENINFLAFQRSNFYTTNFNDIQNLSNLVFIHSIRHPLDQLYSDITKTIKNHLR